MAQDNVERVRGGYEAFNRRDWDAVIELLDPGIEYRMPMEPAGRYPVFRGHQVSRRPPGGAHPRRPRPGPRVRLLPLLVRPRRPGREVAFHDATNPFTLLEGD